MKDFNFSPGKTKSDETFDKDERRIVPAFVKAIVVLCGFMLVLVTAINIPVHLFSPVREVRIHGNDVLSEEKIIKYLSIEKKHAWLALDPYVLSLNLRRNPWIVKAMVHRRFPLGLDIHITENKPIAYLKTKDNLYLLGEGFLVLETMPSKRVWNLPVIVNFELEQTEVGDIIGDSTLHKAADLIDILVDCKILPLTAVSEIIVTNPFNIELITIPYGIKIKLGYQDFKRKLNSLYHVLPKIEWQRQNIEYLDLRTIQGVVMKKKQS